MNYDAPLTYAAAYQFARDVEDLLAQGYRIYHHEKAVRHFACQPRRKLIDLCYEDKSEDPLYFPGIVYQTVGEFRTYWQERLVLRQDVAWDQALGERQP